MQIFIKANLPLSYVGCLVLFLPFPNNFLSHTLLLPLPRVKRWSYAPPVSISCFFGQCVHQASSILYILNSKTYSVPTWLTESTCFSNVTHSSFLKITACFHAYSSKCAATGLLLKLCFPGRIKGNY